MDSNNNNFIVCTDGSQASDQAYKQSLLLFHQFHKIYIVHISDSSKHYLPHEYQSATIYNKFKTELLSTFPSSKYELIFEDKSLQVNNIRDQMLNIANSIQCDFIFIGYHGRKGIKGDPTILGQTVKYSAYNSKIPLIIVKKFYERNPGYNYLVCLDGSKKSYKAIEHTLKLIQDNNKDTIMLCFAPTPDRVKLGESIKEKVKEMLENQNVKWDYEQLNVNMDFGEEIIKFINYNEKVRIDFVVFGSNGERAELSNMSFFGSTSNQILIKALANPIIIP